MWLAFAFLSAALLGFYDVFKKQALAKNSILMVLFASTSLSALFLSPFLFIASTFGNKIRLLFTVCDIIKA